MTHKPRIDTNAELEQAMRQALEEFRAPPDTPKSVAEAMMVDWATAQVSERYELAPEIMEQLILAGVADEVQKEMDADPLATPEQIKTRVGERMQRDARHES